MRDATPLLGGNQDLCILGGALVKLEQFACQDKARFSVRHIVANVLLCIVFVSVIVPIVTLYASVSCAETEDNPLNFANTIQNQRGEDDSKTPAKIVTFVLAELVHCVHRLFCGV